MICQTCGASFEPDIKQAKARREKQRYCSRKCCPRGHPRFDYALLVPMRQLWEEHPEIPATLIAERLNVTKNTVVGQADRNGWNPRAPRRVIERKPPKRVRPPPAPDVSPERTAAANAVVTSARTALAKRQPTTLFTRLDAIHARMEAVLAETRPFVEDRKKVTEPADEQRAAA